MRGNQCPLCGSAYKQQAKVDRLEAVNAELLEALKRLHGDWVGLKTTIPSEYRFSEVKDINKQVQQAIARANQEGK